MRSPLDNAVDQIHEILFSIQGIRLLAIGSLILIHWIVISLAPVDQTLDSAIQWINIYPVDSAIDFPNTYPLDSDLSDG